MPKGITQHQVNAAAEMILGTGSNPTVEKVRRALGTGSPNTVARMLSVWRNQFGERLRGIGAPPEVPGPVAQAMSELWQLATRHAEDAEADRVAKERAALEASCEQLTRSCEALEARLEASKAEVGRAQAVRELAEHACTMLDGQLQDSHALLADVMQERDALRARCGQQAGELEELRATLERIQRGSA